MRTQFIQKATALFQKVVLLQKKVFTWIFLQFIYVLGLGLTSLFGRVFGKEFMEKSPTEWKKHSAEINLKKMF